MIIGRWPRRLTNATLPPEIPQANLRAVLCGPGQLQMPKSSRSARTGLVQPEKKNSESMCNILMSREEVRHSGTASNAAAACRERVGVSPAGGPGSICLRNLFLPWTLNNYWRFAVKAIAVNIN
ncbi:hypothetical protein E2C01_042880 [Portunus trituberculatus]|uniref:Uncharacterized protein n=1 Tax=Portunus trituberculatus TaxID=210409 RepID=A0A5B7FU64_PORTR|nr:hypothetical protein [Portunus trituberculatus]